MTIRGVAGSQSPRATSASAVRQGQIAGVGQMHDDAVRVDWQRSAHENLEAGGWRSAERRSGDWGWVKAVGAGKTRGYRTLREEESVSGERISDE